MTVPEKMDVINKIKDGLSRILAVPDSGGTAIC